MIAVALSVLAVMSASGAAPHAYSAADLSVAPASAASRGIDNDPAVTGDTRRRLGDCLKTPGDGAACVSISANSCPPNVQAYVCANSEYVVWTDYIASYLTILRRTLDVSVAPSLNRSQAAWSSYAGAQCAYIGRLWLRIDPAMRSASVANCKRDEAGRRALALRANILDLARDN